jgi:hypothetical protein
VPGTLFGAECAELSGVTPAANRFLTWDPKGEVRVGEVRRGGRR